MPKKKEWSAVKIADAYAELSKEAFSVWIRMAVESDRILAGGLGRMAETFGYRERGFREILRQLRNAGYIRITTPPHGGIPAPLHISRRPLLVGHDRFVKLS